MSKNVPTNEKKAKDDSRVLLINMIQDNPGEPDLVSPTRDPRYLAQLGFDGDLILNSMAGCTLEKYDPELVPKGSKEYELAMEHRVRITSRVKAIAEAGLSPYLYTDVPTIPIRALTKFPGELTHQGKSQRLCLLPETLWDIVAAQLKEAFTLYPQAEGCFVRFGENYARFDTPHMIGNDVLHSTCSRCGELSLAERHCYAIEHLKKIIIDQLNKRLVIRTWDTSVDGMHANPSTYLNITDRIQPNPNLYFSTKWTRMDFRRYQPRNASLGLGKHLQLVEIQLAREYEGKGSFPNWLGSLWLPEFPEVTQGREIIRNRGEEPPFPDTADRMPLSNETTLKGIFAWTRGGGWGGPYLKYHDWVDVNSFAIGKLAAAPNNFDPADAVQKWCLQEYGWPEDSKATATMLSVLEDSQEAVLKTFYCHEYATRPGSDWQCASLLWFRDDHLVNNAGGLDTILSWASENAKKRQVLAEKAEAIRIWEQMAEKMNSIREDFKDKNRGDALVESVEAAALLAKAIGSLWEVRLRWLESGSPKRPLSPELNELWENFRSYWLAYRAFDGKGVGTLVDTGWQYGLLAGDFEPDSRHFASSARPIYMDEHGNVNIG
jgi:hypothetical protein